MLDWLRARKPSKAAFILPTKAGSLVARYCSWLLLAASLKLNEVPRTAKSPLMMTLWWSLAPYSRARPWPLGTRWVS